MKYPEMPKKSKTDKNEGGEHFSKWKLKNAKAAQKSCCQWGGGGFTDTGQTDECHRVTTKKLPLGWQGRAPQKPLKKKKKKNWNKTKEKKKTIYKIETKKKIIHKKETDKKPENWVTHFHEKNPRTCPKTGIYFSHSAKQFTHRNQASTSLERNEKGFQHGSERCTQT